MRSPLDHRAAVLLPLLAITACTVADPHDGELVTMLHYVQTGRARVDHYLERPAAAALRRAITGARRRCVRLRSEPGSGERHRELIGSGVLLPDGRILTAGRLVPDADGTTTVAFADGSVRRARLLAREQDDDGEVRDWALLAVDRAPVQVPPLAVGRPRRGRLVAILGFPQGVGIDAAGHVPTGERCNRWRRWRAWSVASRCCWRRSPARCRSSAPAAAP